ncbi:helix-turn-helix domain-containing protein [Methyloversatilis sp. NSM2]|uniref:helix-turn-helix domain-containing protein n=1 Tax=Methyloversatilis sp. NSM2 TaxID=3134135 RepID=UPI003117D30C
MLKYKNFSLDDVFLLNGYSETETPEGLVREYADEKGLEQIIRRLVVTRKRFLSGWDMRFIRQGMGLSQAQLGAFLERDSQTIARWEKSKDNVPLLADLAVRIRFCSLFEPDFSAKDLTELAEGSAPAPGAVFLSFLHGSWVETGEPRTYVQKVVAEDGEAEFVVAGFGGYSVSRVTNKSLMIMQSEVLLSASELDLIDARLVGSYGPASSSAAPAGQPAVLRKKSAISFNVTGMTGRA